MDRRVVHVGVVELDGDQLPRPHLIAPHRGPHAAAAGLHRGGGRQVLVDVGQGHSVLDRLGPHVVLVRVDGEEQAADGRVGLLRQIAQLHTLAVGADLPQRLLTGVDHRVPRAVGQALEHVEAVAVIGARVADHAPDPPEAELARGAVAVLGVVDVALLVAVHRRVVVTHDLAGGVVADVGGFGVVVAGVVVACVVVALGVVVPPGLLIGEGTTDGQRHRRTQYPGKPT